MKLSALFRKKNLKPLASLLKQGLSPTKLAVVVSIGFTLSLFPILGTTTFLCAIAAILLRLNLAAIQIANYSAFPLQIILFFPFLQIGETLSGTSLDAISKTTLIVTFKSGFFIAIQELSEYLLLACLGWSIATLPIFSVSYLLLLLFFRKYETVLVSSDSS